MILLIPIIIPLITWILTLSCFGTTVPWMLWGMHAGSIMLPWSQWVGGTLHHEICIMKSKVELAVPSSSCLHCSYGDNHWISTDAEENFRTWCKAEARSEVIRNIFFLWFVSGYVDIYLQKDITDTDILRKCKSHWNIIICVLIFDWYMCWRRSAIGAKG